MASPARSQKSTEAPYSWISRLPVEVRRDIFQLVALQVSRRHPRPTTHVQILIRVDTNLETSDGIPERRYWAKGHRSVAQHEALEPFLRSCKTARAAVLGTQVFSLVIDKDTDHQTDPRYDQFVQDCPQLPLFGGVTQDLILPSIDWDVTLEDLFSTVRHLFGTKIRRIHLTDPRQQSPQPPQPPQPLRAKWISSTQTRGLYLSGQGEKDLGAVEWMLTREPFCSLLTPQTRYEYYTRPVESVFEHKDALAFRISAIQGWPFYQYHPNKLVQICEILRQHSDGQLKMNKGLFPAEIRGGAREKLRAFVCNAKEYFPDLEYVSACVQYSDVDPKTNL